MNGYGGSGDEMYEAAISLSSNFLLTYIVYRFMKMFFQTEAENKKIEYLCYSLFYTAISVGHLFFRSRTLNLILNLLFMYIITGCYEKKRRKRVLVTFMIYSINIGCDFLTVHMFSRYDETKTFDKSIAYIMVFMAAICENMIEKFFSKNKDEKNMPYKHLLVVISAINIALIYFVEYGIQNRILLVLAAVSILLIEIVVFYLYDVLVGAYNKLEEQSLLERQILLYANQLEVLTQSDAKVTAFRHDMKNHLADLAVMAKMQKNKDIEEYIREMGVYMENPKEFVSTGNGAIDSLMNYLLGRAKEQLHKVECEIAIPVGLKISAFNLNVILGNLIENAIEASARSEEKWLFIEIFYEKGMLFINIRNSFSHELNVQDKGFVSTKQEQGHGIGLKNVEKMVENYHGTMEISNTENSFEVDVILYM